MTAQEHLGRARQLLLGAEIPGVTADVMRGLLCLARENIEAALGEPPSGTVGTGGQHTASRRCECGLTEGLVSWTLLPPPRYP